MAKLKENALPRTPGEGSMPRPTRAHFSAPYKEQIAQAFPVTGGYGMKALLLTAALMRAGLLIASGQTPPPSADVPTSSLQEMENTAITKRCAATPTSQSATCIADGRGLLTIAASIDASLSSAHLTDTQKQGIIAVCKFDPAHDDEKALKAKQKCVADQLALKNIAARPQIIEGGAEAPAEAPPPPPPPPGVPVQGGPQPEAGVDSNVSKAATGAAAPSTGAHIGGSVYLTPSTCQMTVAGPSNGSVIAQPDLIGVRRELLAPKEAADVYGHRLGKRYIIYQVRISDYSKDYQFVVHDISLNLYNVLTSNLSDQQKLVAAKLPPSAFLASSRDLEVLRGVPEKGQDYDPRNLSLHILTGIGSVAGGVSGLTAFSDVMGSAVSVFNGAFLQAFVGILPDHTGTQLNRLSDQAFTSNTLVDKLHTKVFAIFIPQSLVLRSGDQSTFWKKPRELLNNIPLDQVDVCVDGSLVTEVSITPSPALSPAGPGVAPGQAITIEDTATDATIYFTDVDGTTPAATSEDKYTAPIQLPSGVAAVGTTKTVRAIAVSPNKAQSSIVSQTYTVQKMPLIKVVPGAAGANPTMTLTAADPDNDEMYYTQTSDGTAPATPTAASTRYVGAIPLPSSLTVKAIEVPKAGVAPASPPVATYSYKGK